ncbi:MAG: hypothetical protein MI974_18355 [Chitinophagales bacterium]|nr:hypothetical protein [Chitinophagales bacterium]
MVSTNEKVEALHFEHRLWTNELKFFADELKIYEHRLEELTQKVLEREALQQLEHFQNQFIRQKEVLDTLMHDINAHEHRLTVAMKNETAFEEDPSYHRSLSSQMESYRSIYADLKKEFMVYLSKYYH